ncbi:MAG: glycine cleavage system aminomethyltransferase GcvT [Longimicrobiaceae bacterium]
MKRTPLYQEHQRLGAKSVPFAGWEMPVQYPTGITSEHRAVRERAGLFDVSHMGEVEVRGPGREQLVQYLTSNDVSRLEEGQAQYSTLLLASGGVIDDLIVYRFDDRLMLVVNAANREKDLAWLQEHAAGFDAEVRDTSDQTALLALQGPGAAAMLAPLCSAELGGIGYYRFAEGEVAGCRAVISRTGYTGEDGFELYLAWDDAPRVWRELLAAGEGGGPLPAGLGARDTLRLEMGYALYGNDLSEERTPLEAALGWIVKLDKGEFIGRGALLRQKEQGIKARLTGFELEGRGFPRPGYRVLQRGEQVARVTSGTLGPSLGKGVGLAYLPVEHARPGTRVEVEIRGVRVAALVRRPPFYQDGTAGK